MDCFKSNALEQFKSNALDDFCQDGMISLFSCLLGSAVVRIFHQVIQICFKQLTKFNKIRVCLCLQAGVWKCGGKRGEGYSAAVYGDFSVEWDIDKQKLYKGKVLLDFDRPG